MSLWQILLISFGFVLMIAGLNKIQAENRQRDQKLKDKIQGLKIELSNTKLRKNKIKKKKR
jgi:hypothetical protein